MQKMIVSVLLVLFLLPLAAPAQQPPAADPAVNLLYSLEVATVDAGGKRTERSILMLGLAGRPSRLTTGWRYPIPTSTEAGAVTAFSYQDVGIHVRLEGQLLGADRVWVEGSFEASAIDPAMAVAAGTSAPKLVTFNQNIAVALHGGQGARIAEVPTPDGGVLVLSMQVTILP